MKTIPELMIIAGTGRNSGKTTLACKLIDRFREFGILSVKISPHIHNQTDGAQNIGAGTGYSIFREYSVSGAKDTTRMLLAGAKESYYIHATDQTIEEAFNWFLKNIANGNPVICESPVLRRFFIPGLFLIADSEKVRKRKDLSHIATDSDLVVPVESADDLTKSVLFSSEGWSISG